MTGATHTQSQKAGLAKWFGRGFWCLVDHGLFTGSNFLVNLCLARWLLPEDYGAFSSAYAVFLFVGVFHTALLTEPMLVFGAGKYREQLRAYLSMLLRGHGVFSLLGGAVLALLGGVAVAKGHHDYGRALFVLAAVQPLMLLPWMLRDACYILGDPRMAAMSGVCYFIVVMGGLWGLSTLGGLNITMALFTMGAAALAATAMLVATLRLTVLGAIGARPRGIGSEHWKYGRWSVLNGVASFVPLHLPLIIVPIILHDYAASGTLKALLNLTVPFVMFAWSFCPLVVPALVARRGSRAFGQVATIIALMLVAFVVVGWLPIAFYGRQIVGLLYDGHFVEHAWLLWLIGLIPLLNGPVTVMHVALRAIERPERIVYATVASSVALVVIGLPLLMIIGLPGIILGMVAGLLAQAVTIWIVGRELFAHASREQHATPSPVGDAAMRPMDLPPLPQQPLVSVLVMCYNYGRFVADAIESVLAQGYANFELIVCDDGSTDDSAAVIQRYVDRDPRVRLIRKANGGQASACNAAYALCRGQIICLLDADDRYAPMKLAEVVKKFSAESTVGLLVHPMIVVDAKGEAIQRIPFLSPFERGWIGDRVVRRGGRWRFMPTSGLVFRRELAQRVMPIPEAPFRMNAESFVFTLGPMLTCVDYIDTPLSEYRLHGSNCFSSKRLDAAAARKDIASICDAVEQANVWLTATRHPVRLRLEDHQRYLEQTFLLAALEGDRGLPRRCLGLLYRTFTDDLYGLKQKLLAGPTYGMMIILPRRWRSDWLTVTMSFSSLRRLFQRRRRPAAHRERPNHQPITASTTEAVA